METVRATHLFLSACEDRLLSSQTIRSYRWALRHLLMRYVELPTKPGQIRSLIETQALSPESKYDLWRVYRTFFRWLQREGVLDMDPTESVPKPQLRRRFPRTLTLSEVKNLFRAGSDSRDRALIALLLDTGMRVGEVAGLCWPMVFPYGVEIHGKTGSRFLPISQKSKQLMEGLGDGYHIWTGRMGPLTVAGIQQVVRRAMYRARILPPKAGPHTLRHTFGRMYVMNGGDVFSLQRLLGHSNLTSTMIYVHMSNQDLIEQHRRYSPLQSVNIN